jgi:hypothetical protein
VPSKRATEPDVTAAPPEVIVAVIVTEAPALTELCEAASAVVVAAGCDGFVFEPPPPEHAERTVMKTNGSGKKRDDRYRCMNTIRLEPICAATIVPAS